MDDPSLHTEPPLTEQGDGLGKDMPLCLLHHPALEYLGGVPLQDLHRPLEDDGAAVGLFIDEVDGSAGELHAVGQGGLVDVEAVVARAAEGGDEGGAVSYTHLTLPTN